jgi:hypothetical protein
MSIEGLIDQTVMEHLSMYGCVKNMDAVAIHMLKNSQHPILRFRRDWMRRTALRQVQEATERQSKMNSALAKIPHQKGANMRQNASLDPWLAEDMRRRHKAELNDKEFTGFIKREEPAIFPSRT